MNSLQHSSLKLRTAHSTTLTSWRSNIAILSSLDSDNLVCEKKTSINWAWIWTVSIVSISRRWWILSNKLNIVVKKNYKFLFFRNRISQTVYKSEAVVFVCNIKKNVKTNVRQRSQQEIVYKRFRQNKITQQKNRFCCFRYALAIYYRH